MSQLSEQYKIIQHFTRQYAGEGDLEQARAAVAAITPVAEKGNAKAQYMLGKYYSWGYGEECDNQKAVYWFEKAADKGNEKAAEALVNLYRYDFPDDEIDADRKRAFVHKWHYKWIEILEEKAAKGVAGAAQALMNLYADDSPEDIDPEDGLAIACKWYDRWIEILKAKAGKGGMSDKKKLADILYYGTGVPDEVLELIEDDDTDTSEDEAATLYSEVAVGENDAEGWCNLGQIYSQSAKDWQKSLDCYMKAAALGHREAYRCVGGAYFEGRGVEKDLSKAREWYRCGADAGDVSAQLMLADCYKRGLGGEKDFTAAMDMYRQIASRSDLRKKYIHELGTAQYEIGNMYMKGLGVDVDLRQAYDWLKLAAGNCNLAAENALNSKKFRDFRK